MGPGATSFEGIGRNGVKSFSSGPGDASYSFKSGEPGQSLMYHAHSQL
jgi:hypothetical protein